MKTRLKTAFFQIASLLCIIYLPHVWMLIAMCGMGVLAVIELAGMLGAIVAKETIPCATAEHSSATWGQQRVGHWVWGACALLCFIWQWSGQIDAQVIQYILATVICLILLSLCCFEPGRGQEKVWSAMAAVITLALLGMALKGFSSMHQQNKQWLVYIMGATAMSDTIGYLIGKSVGRVRIFSRLSPGKTEYGTAAMVLLPAILILLTAGFQANKTTWVFLCIGPLALLGDLWISQIKRVAKVKDTGTIFPGHGGVLDRIDSHMLVLSVVWVVICL